MGYYSCRISVACRRNEEDTMSVASINPNHCDRAPGCPARRVCPQGAISRMSAGEPWTVDPDRCTGCGVCLRVCPTGAVSISELER
ncbi:MAG TPA: 4Fe-4S binding protein [Coriobacteriia bacterium]